MKQNKQEKAPAGSRGLEHPAQSIGRGGGNNAGQFELYEMVY